MDALSPVAFSLKQVPQIALGGHAQVSHQAKGIGTGIPSKPVIVMETTGNQAISTAITGTTNQQITSTPLPLVTLKKLVAWREVF